MYLLWWLLNTCNSWGTKEPQEPARAALPKRQAPAFEKFLLKRWAVKPSSPPAPKYQHTVDIWKPHASYSFLPSGIHKMVVVLSASLHQRCCWIFRGHTFLSKSLSHMSLMVHPAPLINSAPVPKRDSMPRCGKHPGSEASAMLHVHGRYSNHVPK